MDLNKAMIIGNLTRDPEVKTTPAGQQVANFAIATNLVWKDQSGNKQEKAEFHNIVLWRKLAEIAGQYLKKGNKIYIEGRIQTRSWEDQNGLKRYRTEIIGDNLIMLGGKPNSGYTPTGPDEQPAPNNNYAQPEQINSGTPSSNNKEEEINVDDIPF